MKLDKVIRKYRKEQNLTQEQIANYLGVTAPAVNKWENGSSYPDITLLAPLARVLKINLDTLLSFDEDLSEQEIGRLLIELTTIFHEADYEAGFKKGESLILSYPHCDKLILSVVQLLTAYLKLLAVTDGEKYEKKILSWHVLLQSSSDPEIASQATASLCQIYTEKCEFEKAQQLLDTIPKPIFDKKIYQARLYEKQKDYNQAFATYEELVYRSGNQMLAYLLSIMELHCNNHNYQQAEIYAYLCQQTAKLYQLGAYSEYSAPLLLSAVQKDAKSTLDHLEQMVDALNHPIKQNESNLYTHMPPFNQNSDQTKFMLKQALGTDQDIAFIKDSDQFRKILAKL